jgi:hypothetical protein
MRDHRQDRAGMGQPAVRLRARHIRLSGFRAVFVQPAMSRVVSPSYMRQWYRRPYTAKATRVLFKASTPG